MIRFTALFVLIPRVWNNVTYQRYQEPRSTKLSRERQCFLTRVARAVPPARRSIMTGEAERLKGRGRVRDTASEASTRRHRRAKIYRAPDSQPFAMQSSVLRFDRTPVAKSLVECRGSKWVNRRVRARNRRQLIGDFAVARARAAFGNADTSRFLPITKLCGWRSRRARSRSWNKRNCPSKRTKRCRAALSRFTLCR